MADRGGGRGLRQLFSSLAAHPNAQPEELRRAICAAGELLYRRGLIASNDGNISVRLRSGHLLITPAGHPKGGLAPDQLLEVDLDGRPVDPGSHPGPVSTEIALHLQVYQLRPDARAAIHAHPPHATAMTVAGLEFPADVLAEIPLTLGAVPTVPFQPPGTQASAAAAAPYLEDHDAILLKNHGSLTIGPTLQAAFLALERVESVARIYLLAHAAGQVERLPELYLEAVSREGTSSSE